MSAIEITAIEDLREGDYVTLRWEKSEGGTVTLEGPMRFRATVGGYVITDARFVSATREVPDDTAAAVIAAAMAWYQAVEPYDESAPGYDDAFHALRTAVRAHRAAIGGAS